MGSEKFHFRCLQTRGPEKPASFVQSKCAGLRTRGTEDVTPIARAEDNCPSSCTQEERMTGREGSSLPPLFVPFRALPDWMMPAMLGRGNLLSSLIHMLMSPPNTSRTHSEIM